jgi:hypothetical protein
MQKPFWENMSFANVIFARIVALLHFRIDYSPKIGVESYIKIHFNEKFLEMICLIKYKLIIITFFDIKEINQLFPFSYWIKIILISIQTFRKEIEINSP